MRYKNVVGDYLRRVSDMPKTVSRHTLIELLDTGRLIIENHKGVCLYGTEQICIRAYFGTILITGHCLEIAKMSKEQLVIVGQIQGLTMERTCRL